LNHYISIGKARDLCKTDFIGTNLAGMVNAAEKLGFTANAMRGELRNETLDKNIVFPFIAIMIHITNITFPIISVQNK